MPYLKFPTKKDENLAWGIHYDLLEKNGKAAGLVAIVKSDMHGLVSFFSEEPYMEKMKAISLAYSIVPKEQISNNEFVNALREIYPEYANEL